MEKAVSSGRSLALRSNLLVQPSVLLLLDAVLIILHIYLRQYRSWSTCASNSGISVMVSTTDKAPLSLLFRTSGTHCRNSAQELKPIATLLS